MRVWTWGMLAVLASLVPFYWFQLDPVNHSLTYPLFDASGDSVFSWSLTKAIMEGNVVPFVRMHLPQMSAPFGPLLMEEGFPFPEQLQLLVIKIFGFGSDDPIQTQNAYYLFGYVLTSLAFFASAIWLRIRPALAFGLSISFSYLNYHLIRYHHLSLSQYWVLAPAAAVVIKVLDGTIPRSKKSDYGIFITAFLITAWHSYYGYFFCGMYGVAWILKNSRDPVRILLKRLGVPVLGFLLAIGLSTAGHFMATLHSADPPMKFKRFPHETRYYRLRLYSVLLPTPHHRFPPFAEIRERYTRSEGAIEGTDEAIGTLALLGLGFAVYVFFRGKIRKEKNFLDPYGLSAILILFFASSFGIAAWISILVSPVFRSVNRISPMLAATGLFALGVALSKFLDRHDTKKGARVLTSGLGIFLGLFAVWDQVPRFRIDPQIYVELDSVKKFTHAIEAIVGSRAVLQVPNQVFPEGGVVYQMPDYAHQIATVYSRETKWSYGAFKGTRRLADIFSIGERPTDVEAAKKFGYAGVWIDRAGYPDHAAAIESELQRKLDRGPLVSDDGRRSFFLYD